MDGISSTRRTTTESVAVGVVSIVHPVGAVVTDTGHTFALEPVDPLAQPFRLRCTRCRWQAAATGLDALSSEAGRHATSHEHADELAANTRPRGWLTARLRFGGLW